MSEIEYSHLVFKVSERLEAPNLRDQVLFICRRKLASGSEGNNHDVLSLFQQLEERNFLGIDRLEVMKDLLRSFKEWDLLEEVERLESARKEYIGLLEQIISALEEASDRERLIAVCRRKIPEATEGNVRDVRTLFRKLENHNCLGIDYLGILKGILTELEKEDQLKEVEEFGKRRCEAMESQKRNAQVAAVVSSVRAAGERMIGAVSIHCTFRNISGTLLLVSTGLVLRRCSSLEQFVEAFREATLPAANALRAISEGSVCFTVQAENCSALEALWQRYRDGTLQRDLQKFLVTDEIKQLAEGGEVTLGVYIDEQEYNKSLSDLKNVEQDLEQTRYLDQEKFTFIQSYLEKADDARSMTTDPSDSGMPGTQGAPSELAVEEANDATGQFILNDLNDVVTTELSVRLQRDPVALRWFCQAFGLDGMHSRNLHFIGKLFPVTPVKLLKDVFRALKLHDLESLMEKGELCTLRPALPIKEIEKLPNAENRPTNCYSRVEVLIIRDKDTAVDDLQEKLVSFFRLFDTRTEVITVMSSIVQYTWHGLKYTENQMREEMTRLRPRKTVLLGPQREQKKLDLSKNTEQRTSPRMMQMEEKIKEMTEEIRKQMEQIDIAISAVVNKWTRIEDVESTLFIVYDIGLLDLMLARTALEMIGDALYKTLVRIPGTKVMFTRSYLPEIREIPQTLLVQCQTWEDSTFLATILEILYKRWETLDLIAIMQEVQRTIPFKTMSRFDLVQTESVRLSDPRVIIHDSLTCLPRLVKAEENDP